jgi:hypothetical protein
MVCRHALSRSLQSIDWTPLWAARKQRISRPGKRNGLDSVDRTMGYGQSGQYRLNKWKNGSQQSAKASQV